MDPELIVSLASTSIELFVVSSLTLNVSSTAVKLEETLRDFESNSTRLAGTPEFSESRNNPNALLPSSASSIENLATPPDFARMRTVMKFCGSLPGPAVRDENAPSSSINPGVAVLPDFPF